jgi:arylsulfatase A-like enzyme
MKKHLISVCFTLTVVTTMFGTTAIDAAEPVAGKRPNVILIYSDDQGSLDLGCYGTPDIVTPHLDGLAAKGTRFTQMYAPAPVCSTSRTGLMTGKIPIRAGAPGNFSSKAGVPGIPASETTLAEVFKASGYATGHFGKWHLGYTPETMPNKQGFDVSYGHMGGCIDNYSHFYYWEGPNRHDLWKNGVEVFEPGQYFPKRMTDECLEFIEANRETPFFIYLAYNVPHYPLHATEEWHEYYKSITPLDVTFAGQTQTDSDNMPQCDPLTVRGLYCAFVSSMDEQIGRVLETLDKSGLRDNTIIVFQADQGHSFEARTFFGGGYAGIYRGGKFSLFEGGIRVPSIISWPAGIPQGQVRDQMVFGCDWYPTLAALCHVDVPNEADLDGKDISQSISENAPSPHESLYWQSGNQWVVRKGSWKLYGNPQDPSSSGPIPEKDSRLFLSHLEDDPGERTNLVEEHKEIVGELLEIRKQYQDRIEKDRPRKSSTQ